MAGPSSWEDLVRPYLYIAASFPCIEYELRREEKLGLERAVTWSCYVSKVGEWLV